MSAMFNNVVCPSEIALEMGSAPCRSPQSGLETVLAQAPKSWAQGLQTLRVSLIEAFAALKQMPLLHGTGQQVLCATLAARQALRFDVMPVPAWVEPELDLQRLSVLQEEVRELQDTLRLLRDAPEALVSEAVLQYVAGARRELLVMLEDCAVAVMEAEEVYAWVVAEEREHDLLVEAEGHLAAIAGAERVMEEEQALGAEAALDLLTRMHGEASRCAKTLKESESSELKAKAMQLLTSLAAATMRAFDLESSVQPTREALAHAQQLHGEVGLLEIQLVALSDLAQLSPRRDQWVSDVDLLEEELMELTEAALAVNDQADALPVCDQLNAVLHTVLDEITEALDVTQDLQSMWAAQYGMQVEAKELAHTLIRMSAHCAELTAMAQSAESLDQVTDSMRVLAGQALELSEKLEGSPRDELLQALGHLTLELLDLEDALDECESDLDAEEDMLECLELLDMLADLEQVSDDSDYVEPTTNEQLGQVFVEAAELKEDTERLSELLCTVGDLLQADADRDQVLDLAMEQAGLLQQHAQLAEMLNERAELLLQQPVNAQVRAACLSALGELATALEQTNGSLVQAMKSVEQMDSEDSDEGDLMCLELSEALNDVTCQMLELGLEALDADAAELETLQKKLVSHTDHTEALDDMLSALRALHQRDPQLIRADKLALCDEEMLECLTIATEVTEEVLELRQNADLEEATAEAESLCIDLMLEMDEITLLTRRCAKLGLRMCDPLSEHVLRMLDNRSAHLADALEELAECVAPTMVELCRVQLDLCLASVALTMELATAPVLIPQPEANPQEDEITEESLQAADLILEGLLDLSQLTRKVDALVAMTRANMAIGETAPASLRKVLEEQALESLNEFLGLSQQLLVVQDTLTEARALVEEFGLRVTPQLLELCVEQSASTEQEFSQHSVLLLQAHQQLSLPVLTVAHPTLLAQIEAAHASMESLAQAKADAQNLLTEDLAPSFLERLEAVVPVLEGEIQAAAMALFRLDDQLYHQADRACHEVMSKALVSAARCTKGDDTPTRIEAATKKKSEAIKAKMMGML